MGQGTPWYLHAGASSRTLGGSNFFLPPASSPSARTARPRRSAAWTSTTWTLRQRLAQLFEKLDLSNAICSARTASGDCALHGRHAQARAGSYEGAVPHHAHDRGDPAPPLEVSTASAGISRDGRVLPGWATVRSSTSTVRRQGVAGRIPSCGAGHDVRHKKPTTASGLLGSDFSEDLRNSRAA